MIDWDLSEYQELYNRPSSWALANKISPLTYRVLMVPLTWKHREQDMGPWNKIQIGDDVNLSLYPWDLGHWTAVSRPS